MRATCIACRAVIDTRTSVPHCKCGRCGKPIFCSRSCLQSALLRASPSRPASTHSPLVWVDDDGCAKVLSAPVARTTAAPPSSSSSSSSASENTNINRTASTRTSSTRSALETTTGKAPLAPKVKLAAACGVIAAIEEEDEQEAEMTVMGIDRSVAVVVVDSWKSSAMPRVETATHDLDLRRWVAKRWYETYRYVSDEVERQLQMRGDAYNISVMYGMSSVVFTHPPAPKLAVRSGLPPVIEDPYHGMRGQTEVVYMRSSQMYRDENGHETGEFVDGFVYADADHNARTPVGRGRNTHLWVRVRESQQEFMPPVSHLVLAFDVVEYTYAVVATPTLDTVWVFSVTPTLEPRTLARILFEMHTKHGIDPAAFTATRQTNTSK